VSVYLYESVSVSELSACVAGWLQVVRLANNQLGQVEGLGGLTRLQELHLQVTLQPVFVSACIACQLRDT
jgi:hypothetical protein